MAKPLQFTAEQVIEAIHQAKGMVSVAATILKCSPDTVYNYRDRYASVRKAIEEERELMTDVAELALYKQIQAGEGWAVCFYLKTQGRNRGYGDSLELRGAKDAPLEVRHSFEFSDLAALFAANVRAQLAPPDPDRLIESVHPAHADIEAGVLPDPPG